VFAASISSIRPVVSMTGIKNIARNAARPAIFWLSMIAINRENRTIEGISSISCVRPDTSVVTYDVSKRSACANAHALPNDLHFLIVVKCF